MNWSIETKEISNRDPRVPWRKRKQKVIVVTMVSNDGLSIISFFEPEKAVEFGKAMVTAGDQPYIEVPK